MCGMRVHRSEVGVVVHALLGSRAFGRGNARRLRVERPVEGTVRQGGRRLRKTRDELAASRAQIDKTQAALDRLQSAPGRPGLVVQRLQGRGEGDGGPGQVGRHAGDGHAGPRQRVPGEVEGRRSRR